MKKFILILLIILPTLAFAQNTGVISGSVIDKNTLKALEAATIILTNLPSKGTVTDSAGNFKLSGIPTGAYTIRISSIGYLTEIKYNVVVSSGNENNLQVELDPVNVIKEVKIYAGRTVNATSLTTPLSVQRLTSEEIKSNPGGNFDISRVIQSLPGVSGTSGSSGGFRNDIIIRGGAPNENVFYLDGIEVPVINHFSTQGSGGGPTGILNVSFIQDVKLSTSAFDARYDNTLSSVFQFTQKTGNPNHIQGNIRLSGTELAATFDGPVGATGKTTFLASARRSYLQLLFQLIDLPIRPNYWDFQTKVTHKIDAKTTLNFIGIGAIDEFSFAAVKNATPEKLYVLNNSPAINQYSYTAGLSLKRQLKKGFLNLALSRDLLNNKVQKFDDNQWDDPGRLRLNIKSEEAENKLRLDVNFTDQGWQWSCGASVQYEQFANNYYQRYRSAIQDNSGTVVQPAIIFNTNSSLNFWRYGAFAQVGKRIFNDRLGISGGIRTDLNSFTADGNNPLNTISPRIALSYTLTNQWHLNASVGTYFKIPTYTILGFQDNAGSFVNQNTQYIRSTHYVSGLEYLLSNSTRFTVEGFYKRYSNYPISVRDGISLANEGGDFTVVGNEAVKSEGKGESFGLEFFAQQKLTDRFFGVISLTLFKSSFSGINGKYEPTAWDTRQLLSLTLGYRLPRSYEIGLKFRYQGGAPYTPFNAPASRVNYQTTGAGVLDFNQVNSSRLNVFNQSDIRIDKKWNFRKVTLDAYIDVTNWYAAKTPSYPSYTFKRNDQNTAFITTDGKPLNVDGSNAMPVLLNNNSAQVTPTIGFILEF